MKYEYFCSSCEATFEADQRMTDDALTACRECGAEGVERLIGGGAGVIMKGGASAAPAPSCQSCPSMAQGGGCPYGQ